MHKTARKTRPSEYPDETAGSKLAAEARKLANTLTDEQRAECLESAKGLIYGRTKTGKAAGAGR